MIPQPPARGQIWLFGLHPTRRREQAGTGFSLIASVDSFNQSALAPTVVVPIISQPKDSFLHVRFAQCEGVRSVSREGLSRPLGRVTRPVARLVEDWLRLVLGL